jgi:hypothetical protein
MHTYTLTPSPISSERGDAGVQVYAASNAHCRYILVRNFYAGVRALATGGGAVPVPPSVVAVLQRLAHLFALYWIEQACAPPTLASSLQKERESACVCVCVRERERGREWRAPAHG